MCLYLNIILYHVNSILYHVQRIDPYTVAPRYNAESDITRSVVDPDFRPPGVKWLGLYDGQ